MAKIASAAMTDIVKASEERPDRVRVVAMATAVALHLAVLALLAIVSSSPTLRNLPPALTIDLTLPQTTSDADAPAAADAPADAPDPTPRPPPPAALEPLPETPLPIPETELVDVPVLTPQFDAEPDPATTGDVSMPVPRNAVGNGASGGCSLAESVSQALERDAEAKAALARIPAQSRSVANAVMLWDGRWIAPERVGGQAALISVQTAVAEALASAPAECRSRSETGPVLLILNDAPETIVLALGSGTWRWSDLSISMLPDDD